MIWIKFAAFLLANRLWGWGVEQRPEANRENGWKPVYARTFGPSQHYAWDMFTSRTTVCGLPLTNWSTGEMRTPLGITCWRCKRGVWREAVRVAALRAAIVSAPEGSETNE